MREGNPEPSYSGFEGKRKGRGEDWGVGLEVRSEFKTKLAFDWEGEGEDGMGRGTCFWSSPSKRSSLQQRDLQLAANPTRRDSFARQ